MKSFFYYLNYDQTGMSGLRFYKIMLLPNEKEHHRRNLPHWQPDNAVFFITPRLKGSIPKEKIEAIRAERLEIEESLRAEGLSEEELKEKLRLNFNLYFGKFDALLDGNSTGPHWLSEDTIAEIWMNALFHFDDKRYKLICSTVMSNHAHFIFYKLDRSLSRTMKTLKGYSAREANKILNRTGEHFWQDESFDRVIRNRRELGNCINYILNNPVKIGLVKHWKDWKYNYIRPDFLKYVL